MQPDHHLRRQQLGAADRDRLTKLCGLFGSDHAGERANAAAMADRLLRDRGLRWPDVLGVVGPDNAASHRSNDDVDQFAEWPGGWRSAVQHCLRYGSLSSWERSFLLKLSDWLGEPSNKQLAIVKILLDRCIEAGERAA